MGREEDIEAFHSLLRRMAETPIDTPENIDRHRMGETIALSARPRDSMNRPINFERTINLGHILQAAAMVAGMAALGWTFAGRIAVIESDVAALKAREARIGPKMDALEKSQDVQDYRIQNMSEAVAEIRRGNMTTTTILSQIREDLATLKARLQIQTTPERPDRHQ